MYIGVAIATPDIKYSMLSSLPGNAGISKTRTSIFPVATGYEITCSSEKKCPMAEGNMMQCFQPCT